MKSWCIRSLGDNAKIIIIIIINNNKYSVIESGHYVYKWKGVQNGQYIDNLPIVVCLVYRLIML